MYLDKRSELPCFFLLKRVQKFAKQAKNVSCRTCKDYIIGREVTTLLKITVVIVTTKKGSCKLLIIASFSHHGSCPDISQRMFQIKTITSLEISQRLRMMVQSDIV